MPVTRNNVLHIAKLAHLRLNDAEVAAFQADLGHIVSHIERLNQLNTNNIRPTAHVAVSAAPMREDIVLEGLSNDVVLAEAPRPRDGGFAVPAFVDEV